MSSLASLVNDGIMQTGDSGTQIKALQLALNQAGYRVDDDGIFGPGTEAVIESFQRQHGLVPDGVVGVLTAHLLDAPHTVLVANATPEVAVLGFPHDDSASLLAFYGKPWVDSSLLVEVPVPFTMTFLEDNGVLTPIHNIKYHKKAAASLTMALNKIAQLAADDPTILKHVTHFSGSYNYRPVRGSSRLSCHAFGAALDFDAENLPMGTRFASAVMPQAVVDAFKAAGFYWGGDFHGRPDAMHFQNAHE